MDQNPLSNHIPPELAAFRRAIDDIDRRLVELLRARYDVIEAVGAFKAPRGIPAVIPERVQEVEDNAARHADNLDLDAAFIRALYQKIIAHSCALEEQIIARRKNGSSDTPGEPA